MKTGAVSVFLGRGIAARGTVRSRAALGRHRVGRRPHRRPGSRLRRGWHLAVVTATRPPELPPDGPTELVEGSDGELVERLSTGTATLLLVWLVGTGAATALLAAWLFAAVVLRQRLGVGELFSSLGLYIAVFGAAG